MSLSKSDLSGFIGTSQWFKHPFGIIFTEGVSHLADKGNCFWFLDIIASYQHELTKNHFQIWGIKKDKEGNGALVYCKEDTNEPHLVEQILEYADFPFEEFELYCINDGQHKTVLLKSEY